MNNYGQLAKVAWEIVDKQDLDFDFGYIGVRFQAQPFSLGKIDHVSHIWIDGDDTGEELNGICAVNLQDLDRIRCEYPDSHAAIIAGNRATYGEDFGEIIIEDPIVAAILY